MAVSTPPGRTDPEQERDLEQRVADLEALIEEARRRARRRRMRNGAALAVAAAAVVAGLIGFHGGGGGAAGTAAPSGGSGAQSHAATPTPSLAPIPEGNPPSAFAFDPRRPNIVYVASRDARGGMYVYKTTDNGRHWRSTGARGAGWTSDILSLTAEPQHSGTLYAGTDTAVYKTVDGGRSWRPFKQGLFPPKPRVCDRPPTPGTRKPPICGQFSYGTPGATSWNRNNGWVLDVAVDPRNSNVAYSAAGDAVRKSTDGGRTWKTVLAPSGTRSQRMPELGIYVSRIAIASTHPESVYAIMHISPHGETAIYKSTDGGTTWQETGRGSTLPPSCCGDSQDALVVDPGDPETLYAAVGDTVFATTDGGAAWHPIADGLPANEITSLAADPRQAGTVYAGVERDLNHVHPQDGVGRLSGAIYKTTDGGQTWSKIYTGIGVEKIAVDPARPSTIFAAGWAQARWNNVREDTFAVLRSTDSGLTWIVAG